MITLRALSCRLYKINKSYPTGITRCSTHLDMHIDFEWPRILTPSYWLARAHPCLEAHDVEIRNIVQREEDEPDCLIAILVVNHADADEHNPDYIDLVQLQLSLSSTGTYFPWTCSCGAPGCAGMFNGVRVSHAETHTTWIDLDCHRNLRFQTDLMASALDHAVAEGRRMLDSSPGLEPTPEQNTHAYIPNGG